MGRIWWGRQSAFPNTPFLSSPLKISSPLSLKELDSSLLPINLPFLSLPISPFQSSFFTLSLSLPYLKPSNLPFLSPYFSLSIRPLHPLPKPPPPLNSVSSLSFPFHFTLYRFNLPSLLSVSLSPFPTYTPNLPFLPSPFLSLP